MPSSHWMPQAVVFDLDGLVLDSERCYFRCWQKAATDLGFELPEAQYVQLLGIPNELAEKLLSEMLGPAFPQNEFSLRWNAHWNEMLDHQEIPLKPGVSELLDFLGARSIARAIASSSCQRDVLRCLGQLAHEFPVIVSRDMVPQGKPAPDLFLEAARKLNVAPGRCLALEDSNVGVQAAVLSGMPVILVPDMEVPSTEAIAKAWRVCPSLYEVLILLSDAAAQPAAD